MLVLCLIRPHAGRIFVGVFFLVMAAAVNVVRRGTYGSLLIVTIFHAASNTVGTFVPAEAAVTVLLAAIVVIVFGPAHLSRRGERVVQKEGS